MKFFIHLIVFFEALFLIQGCDAPVQQLEMVSSGETSVLFSNELSPTKELNILTYLYYYNGGGVSVSDYNNDGLDDLYFTCNQCPDRLYMNQGGFKFTDITKVAQIDNSDGWTTGVSHVDINDDGFMDLYVCKVGDYRSLKGQNLLYINQGINQQGVPVFKEAASAYGLDVTAFSTQSAFFDYDLDGDLDMFLLCHSVHPNRSYGKGKSRENADSLAGDRLFENRGGRYVDVSKSAGLFQGKIGYGLGIIVSDVNKDGFPDLYVGNDFFENDYLYINNGDKTFSEVISKDFRKLGHTSHYSMGNSAADLNNDGLTDIVSLDMLPEDLSTLKSSGAEDAYPIYHRYLSHGYAPQFMQNTLHLNRGNNVMSEVGFQAGIASTEWSWGVLCGDLDLDGYKDLFITNGIPGATNDLDYIKFIVEEDVQRTIEAGDGESVLSFIRKIPEKKVPNYVFRNLGNATFEDMSDQWIQKIGSFSNGSAFGDFDNDGDLDMAVNNINEKAFILRNNTRNTGLPNYLKIVFQGASGNRWGIGAKVELYAGDIFLYEENYPVKSYLSASPGYMLCGLGNEEMIDSVRVIWPDNKTQLLTAIESNKTLTLRHSDATAEYQGQKIKNSHLTNVSWSLPFKHEESQTLDFDRDPLIPFALSNEGPALSVADVNGDSLMDIFIGGAKLQKSAIFLQYPDGTFKEMTADSFGEHAVNEDIDALFLDADGDQDYDLVVVSGGNEFEYGPALQPRLYLNEGGAMRFVPQSFGEVSVNASCVRSLDIDLDGDSDLVIASNGIPRHFGETPRHFIFENDGHAKFTNVSGKFGNAFMEAGNINDIKVADIDANGYGDLVCVGDWMPVTIFLNDGIRLTPVVIKGTEGWWNAVSVADFDRDGDLDLAGGNWGINTRLRAGPNKPITLYRHDFDDNGSTETIVTYFYKGKEALIATKDELARQLPMINKQFLSYTAFSQAELHELLPARQLNAALKKRVYLLESCFFENLGDLQFSIRALPANAQSSTVNDMLVDDFDSDGYEDLMLIGNNYEISTQLGRLDASHGVLLLNDQAGGFTESSTQSFDVAGPSRIVREMRIGGETYYIVGINDTAPAFLKKTE